MAIQEGQKFGNYKVLSRLGVGGMGAVYLAEHPLIGKKVALKAIHKEFAHNKEVVARFFNEARAVNKIGNEHIVEIHDFGQGPDGEHFFIMEYLEGPTLAEILQQEQVLHPQRALHIAAQIAAGLAAAHACGIIHRDLKPDNIMLVPRLGDKDFVKILDFGLAKMFADASAKLTQQGVVLGTPQYMAPEACESKQDIDHRSDIYALGILLFQMLCGQVPFDGNTMGEVLVKHVGQPPPAPRGFNPEIPPSVEQIILRCLAKKRDARFGTMKELREALLDSDRYLASSPPVMPSASSASAKTVFGKSGPVPIQAPPPGAAPPGAPSPVAPPAAAPPGAPPAMQHAGGGAAHPRPGGHPRPGSHAPVNVAAAVAATVAPDQTNMAPAHHEPGRHNALAPGMAPPATSPAQVAAAAAPAKTVMLGEGQSLPLAAPPPSIVGAPAVGTASASAKTAFHPAVGEPPPANGSGGMAAAKTAFMDGNAVSIGSAPEMPRRTISAVPDMNPPAAPVNMTMVIGTPEGYSDKPPRKSGPLVLILLAVFAVAAAGVALFVFPGFLNKKSDGDESSGGAAEVSIDAGAAKTDDTKVATKPKPAVTPDAAPVAPPKPDKPKTVEISFMTSIAGAEVFDKDNKFLCKTPCDLELPNDGKAHVVTIKHPKAKTRNKTIVPKAGLEMTVDLERKAKRRRRNRRRTPRNKTTTRKPKVGDGVQDPDF